jgi:predicted nucleic acid-binding protein
MIAVDSSTWIAYVQGQTGPDVDKFDESLAAGMLSAPLVVLCEILSEPKLPDRQRTLALSLPTLEVTPGFWVRAAAIRAAVLKRRLRARLADALIAQSCIDHDVSLITRNGDFRHFAAHCGLRLA